MNTSGKVAVVIGASSGIGRSSALALAGRGMRIVGAARRRDGLDVLVSELEERGGSGLAVECDIRDERQVVELFDRAVAAYGRVDVVVNSAGLGFVAEPFVDQSVQQWRDRLEVNVLGLMIVCREACRRMVANPEPGGTIVNVSSLSGRTHFATATAGPYAPSKAAVNVFTEALRRDVASDRIRVILIEPGVFRTGLSADRPAHVREKLHSEGAQAPDEVGEAIAYVVAAPPEITIRSLAIAATRQRQ